MRLPFMQLESDLVAHGASTVARLARCSVPQALGHIALLRAWAVSRATDEAPPDGLVEGDPAERLVEAAAGWEGEKGALLQALLDAGQVAREETGLRVLHLNPYVTAWERNAKAKARMANARERSANKAVTYGERSAKFGGQTQTQTQATTSYASAVAVSGDVDESPDATDHAHSLAQSLLLAVEVEPEKPKRAPKAPAAPKGDARHHPLFRAMDAAYAEVLPGEKWDTSGNMGGREAKAISALLAKADATPETSGEKAPAEVLRRWRNALGDHFSRVRYAHVLVDRWGAYATARSAGPAVNHRAPVRAESQPQYDPSKPAVQSFRGKDAL